MAHAAATAKESAASSIQDSGNQRNDTSAEPEDGVGSAAKGRPERQLSSRHMQFIAIGGTIGTGIFLGSGTGLAKAGPVGCLLSYVFVGSILYSVMTSLGELATFLPVAGSFTEYPARFVDRSLAFANGWMYWGSWAVTFALELTAAGLIIQFWRPDLSVAIFVGVFLPVFTLVNLLPSKVFGEIEMWLSILKVITIVGFAIFGIAIAAGAGQQGTLGFKNWTSHGGPFAHYLVLDRPIGQFIGFWAVLVQASFAYQGTELVGVAVGEAHNPRKTVPRAIKTSFWTIFSLFVVTIFFVSLLVPSDNEALGSSKQDATASPLVIAAELAGVPVLSHIINAVLLTAVLSAANANVYSGSRVLVGLAERGYAPRILARTFGVLGAQLPVPAVLVTAAVGLLGFLKVSSSGESVFNWLLNIVGVSGMFNWGTINLSFLRFQRALEAQRVSRRRLPYVAPLQPYSAWYGLFFNVLIIVTQGFTVFIGDFDGIAFVAAYISPIIFVVMYAGHKVQTRCGFVDPRQADIATDAMPLLDDESAAEAGELEPARTGLWTVLKSGAARVVERRADKAG